MSASNAEPIAVIGVGCRFPGGVDSAAGLWRLVAAGRRTAGPVPASRWDAARLAAFHDPDDAARAGVGCFVDGDIWAWDPVALSVASAEQRWVDPQFRLLAEVAWEAVEHAGLPLARLRGSRTGVYVGTYAPDNLFREARPVEDAPNSPYLFGNFTAGAAGRVAFAMDLRGPVMVVSTHCSSGLVAVDAACGALTLGECDTALAGAVLLMVSPETQYYEAPLLLSRRGACHAFDARADGYVRGEGAGMLVLKRLADARRDGDRVLAVIRGSAVNNDGQASRLTAPSTVMQQQLFREAAEKAGIDPAEVGLVEAHGPGTAVGDPIEYTSIDAVYGQGRGRCALGSVKTNIGHSEPVSGVAGTIKAIECLRRGQIPPNLNFERWNPSILRDGRSRLFVPTEMTPWPVDGGTRLAAVCSYGVTGTNAHLVLAAAPEPTRPRPARRDSSSVPAEESFLLTVSGSSPQSLSLTASRLADWSQGEGADTSLLDVAHTLAMRRSAADHRLTIVARSHAELATRARTFAAGAESDGVVSGVPVLPPSHGGPVFVFTGQGSQRPGMCQGMLRSEPVFRAVIEELEPLIRREAGFSVREMIARPEALVGLARIQPTLFAVQVALAAVWRSWGIEPAAVIGQSLGEVAAMVVAGGLSAADGVTVICRRSALLATIFGGGMASVMLGADQVQAAIDEAGADGVSLGVLTSPGSTVVSGDAAQIAALAGRWEADGVVVRVIDVDVASHSPEVDPILDELRAKLAALPTARPVIPFYSTVTTDPREPETLDGEYWVRNQRQTVRFHAAVSAALADGHRLFIECTAHPLAVRPILDTARHDGVHDAVAVGSLRQGSDDQDAFLTHLGQLHAAGYDGIDFSSRYGDGQLVDVPGTAWHRTRHGGDAAPYRLVAPHLVGADQHPLLGGFVQDPDHPERFLWQTPISPARLPWLGDHRVAGVPVLPGTGMVEMMLAAAARIFATDRVSARDVTVMSPLILDPEPLVTTRLVRDGDTAVVEIVSAGDGGVAVHARGTVRPLPEDEYHEALTPAAIDADSWQDREVAALHRTFREKHDVLHGPAFTAIDRIHVHPAEDLAVSWLHTHEAARVSAWPMSLHPALADQVVQTAVAAWLAHYPLTPGPVVVAGFEEVRVYGPTTHTRRASVRLHQADDLGCTASAQLAAVDGTVVAEVRGLRVSNITSPGERFTARLSHQEWVPNSAPENRPRATDGTWVVLDAQDAAWPSQLARQLDSHTAGCHLLPLSTVLDDPTALPPCRGVVLALSDERLGEESAVATRELVSLTLALVRRLSQWEHPPRLWALSRAGRTPLTSATVRGLFRTLAYEHPELCASILEFTAETTSHADIVAELLDDRQSLTETALLPHGRHTAHVLAGPDTIAHTGSSLVHPEAAYLVTGGLGGLGLLTVEWLARLGAGRVIIVSRSRATPETDARLHALRKAGSGISLVRGDIADPAVAAHAVAAAGDDGRTLRGVIHAAGVVEDATVANLDDRLLQRVWRGKAEGAWALHQATEASDLDLFVVYSSVASLVGSPGQAAYTAANAFLDGLVAHRLHHGRPATGIQWGAWSEVGRGQHLAQRGFLTITPGDGIGALERILDSGYHQVAYSPLDIGQWTAPYPAVRTSTLLAPLLADDEMPDETVTVRETLLAAASLDKRRELLQTFIISCIRELLGGTTRHIGPHTSMVILGLDSLGAVQLQLRLQRALRTEMKLGVIWVKPSAASLADWLLEHLGLHSDKPTLEAEETV